MYKSKLQELCHGKQWGLPRYTVMKHGADHNPCFNASVRVHGFSFDSPTTCKSSKQAQNQAAMLAFLHFTSPPSTSIFSDSSILSTVGPYFDVPKNEELDKCFIQPEDYASVKDAPFKDTISADEHTFFNTLKGRAEHAPAKAVSMSWSQDGSQKNVETIHYKNLLQELVQREGFSIPAYKTVISGASHMPTFSSTVEVEGQDFRGIAGKSKKLAELNAAKVAYITLKERAMSRASELTSHHLIQAALKATQSSDFKVTFDNSLKNHTLKDRFVSSPATKDEQCAKDIKGTSDNLSANSNLKADDSNSSHEELQTGDMNETKMSSASSKSLLLSTEESSSSTALTQTNLAAASIISDTNAENSTGVKSYLLYKRVRVYTQYPDIASPNSMTVLPIGDDKWVPFCLEFPNEENN